MTPIAVEIVQSPGQRRVDRVRLEVRPGSTVADALRVAGLVPDTLSVAVWGQRASLQQALREGDRIELLRPLQVDPKDARRARARQAAPKTKRPDKAGR